MAARKDLLKAHTFTQQRLVSALVDRDPDNPSANVGRLRTALLVSILIGALVVAGFGVFGFLTKPGANSWEVENAIVIDTSSGVVFVVIKPAGSDGLGLYPVTNMASARLITGGGQVIYTNTAKLAGAPRGPRYGIVDAPTELPDPKNMVALPLRVCSVPNKVGQPRYTVLDVAAPTVEGTTAVAVTDSDKQTYLVIDGVTHKIRQPKLVESSIAAPLADAFIRSLPNGQAIEPLALPDKGNPVGNLGKVGDIVEVGDKAQPEGLRYYVLLTDGYSQISYLDMRATVGSATNVDENQVLSHTSSSRPRIATAGLPLGPVKFTDVDLTTASVCATYQSPGNPPLITTSTDIATPDGNPAVTSFDEVKTVAGGGALLRGSETSAAGTAFLVWDGKKYGIPDETSRAALGYASAPTAGIVPAQLIALIPDGLPQGVALDQAHALQPA